MALYRCKHHDSLQTQNYYRHPDEWSSCATWQPIDDARLMRVGAHDDDGGGLQDDVVGVVVVVAVLPLVRNIGDRRHLAVIQPRPDQTQTDREFQLALQTHQAARGRLILVLVRFVLATIL